MTLVHLIKKFLHLEVMAAELYHAHLKHVPVWMQPLIHHFERIEHRHVTRFAKLYREVTGVDAPTFPSTKKWMQITASFIALFGTPAILKFECWIEARAIRDYQAALTWVDHDALRDAINQVLKDEEFHGRFMDTLKLFQHDEQKHIREMKKILKKLEG